MSNSFKLACGISLWLSATICSAAEIHVIEQASKPEISGKELDWIYGDYLMKNDQISLTIAAGDRPELPVRFSVVSVLWQCRSNQQFVSRHS